MRNEKSSCSNSAVVSVSSVLKTCSTVLVSGRTELVLDTSDLSYRSLVRTSAPPPKTSSKSEGLRLGSGRRRRLSKTSSESVSTASTKHDLRKQFSGISNELLRNSVLVRWVSTSLSNGIVSRSRWRDTRRTPRTLPHSNELVITITVFIQDKTLNMWSSTTRRPHENGLHWPTKRSSRTIRRTTRHNSCEPSKVSYRRWGGIARRFVGNSRRHRCRS